MVIDTRNGPIDGIVHRVDPGVTEGTVIVDVDLQGTLPAGARPQLPVEGMVYMYLLTVLLKTGSGSLLDG